MIPHNFESELITEIVIGTAFSIITESSLANKRLRRLKIVIHVTSNATAILGYITTKLTHTGKKIVISK